MPPNPVPACTTTLRANRAAGSHAPRYWPPNNPPVNHGPPATITPVSTADTRVSRADIRRSQGPSDAMLPAPATLGATTLVATTKRTDTAA